MSSLSMMFEQSLEVMQVKHAIAYFYPGKPSLTFTVTEMTQKTAAMIPPVCIIGMSYDDMMKCKILLPISIAA